MFTLELFSYVLVFPNDAKSLSQFWLTVYHSVKSTASLLVDIEIYWEGNFEDQDALQRCDMIAGVCRNVSRTAEQVSNLCSKVSKILRGQISQS